MDGYLVHTLGTLYKHECHGMVTRVHVLLFFRLVLLSCRKEEHD